MHISNAGKNSGNFNGYIRHRQGYIMRVVPDHPQANSRGEVYEHRIIVEEYLGVILPKGFVVHHINGIKDDNRIENLAVMTKGAHSALHGKKGRNMPKGEKNKKYKPVDIQKMKELRASGMKITEICKIFDICRYTYYRKMKEVS